MQVAQPDASVHVEETLVAPVVETEASAPTCVPDCCSGVRDACANCMQAECRWYSQREEAIRRLLSNESRRIGDHYPELLGAMVKASMRLPGWDVSKYAHISLEEAGKGAQGSAYKMVLHRKDGHFHAFLVKRLNTPRSHPHPMGSHTVGPRHVRVFVALERSELQQWVPGITLAQLDDWLMKVKLTQSQRLSTKLFAALQCLRALQSIYDKGIAHNDLKPSNIMCNHRGKVVIIDPGCERSAGSDAELIEGTPSFADPARCDCPGGAPHSDVFSLGQMLTQILSSNGKTLNNCFLDLYHACTPGHALSLLTDPSSYAVIHYQNFCEEFLHEEEEAETQPPGMQDISKALAATKQLAIDMIHLSPEKRPTLQECIERLKKQMRHIQTVDPGCTDARLAALSIMGGISNDPTSHLHLRGLKGIVTIDQKGTLKCTSQKREGENAIPQEHRTFSLDQTVGKDKAQTFAEIQDICKLRDESMRRLEAIMGAFVSLRCNAASDGTLSLGSEADTQVVSSPVHSAIGWKSFVRFVRALLHRK